MIVRTVAAVLLLAVGAAPAWAQGSAAQGKRAQDTGAPANGARGIVMDELLTGRPAFPAVWQPYRPASLPPVDLENGPLPEAQADGQLPLSLAQFLRLVVDNDLSLEDARYNFAIAAVDVLRAKSGQAARGLPNTPLPGAVFAGAIGAAVNTTAPLSSGGTGGVSITTQGKLVSFGARGIFDPTFNVALSYDHLTNPLNTVKVSGNGTLVIPTTVLQTRFQQELPTGTSYSVSFNLQRQATTQANLLFNPALGSFGALQIYQPLLNGFGRPFTQRFVTLAEHNRSIVREAFHATLNDRLSAAANAYWDLVAVKEAQRVAEEALRAADQQHNEDLQRVDIGVMTPLDALTSESQLAAARVQLVNADTAVRQQEVLVETYISKHTDARLESVVIDPTESLPDASTIKTPDADEGVARALDRRSSIKQAQLAVENQRIAEGFTKKNLLPVLSAYVALDLYGLAASTPATVRELVHWAYPEYSVGFTWSLPVFNRAAQADDVRARLETQQSEAALQRTRTQVALQVRSATDSIDQNQARVRAADRALVASKAAYEGEQERLRSGISTPYRVLQSQRDMTAAESAYVQARVNYAKSVTAYDVAVSGLVDKYSIDVNEAERGTLWRDR